jgi:hypothetical protein
LDLAGQRNGSFVLFSSFLDKFQPVGGLMSHSQIATGGPNLTICPVKLFKHTTINQRVAGLWLNWPGDKKAALFCGRQHLTKNQRLGG